MPKAGVPDRVPLDESVTPLGRPLVAKVMGASPDAVTGNVPKAFSVNVVVALLVKTAAVGLTVSTKFCTVVLPFPSVAVMVKLKGLLNDEPYGGVPASTPVSVCAPEPLPSPLSVRVSQAGSPAADRETGP